MFVAIAHAMGAPGGGAPQQGGAVGMFQAMLPLIIIFAIFYFLVIRPQSKKAKDHRAMIDGLKKGDSVLTNGGIYGTVFSLTGNTVVLVLNEGGTKIKVNKNYIAGIASPGEEAEGEKTS